MAGYFIQEVVAGNITKLQYGILYYNNYDYYIHMHFLMIFLGLLRKYIHKNADNLNSDVYNLFMFVNTVYAF